MFMCYGVGVVATYLAVVLECCCCWWWMLLDGWLWWLVLVAGVGWWSITQLLPHRLPITSTFMEPIQLGCSWITTCTYQFIKVAILVLIICEPALYF